MRRFFLILLAMSFLALMLAQPSMRQTARLADASASGPEEADAPQLPEILATNMSEGDTLIGIKPLDPDSLTVENDSVAATMTTDSLSRVLEARTMEGTDSIDGEEWEREEFEETDSIDDDRTGMTRINREKVDLDNSVTFSAKDSVILYGNKLAYFFGEGEVEYGRTPRRSTPTAG